MSEPAPIQTEFSMLLEREWLSRRQGGLDFSLRKFAEFLDVDPTALSRLLNGSRQPTMETFRKIVDRLGLSASEVRRYGKTIKGRRGRPTRSETPSPPAPPDYHELDQDVFAAISSWYYAAILEATRLDDFKPDTAWLAKHLGLSPLEVKIAVAKLQKLDLLRIAADGSWICVFDHVSNIHSRYSTSEARRTFQKQLLAKAAFAIDEYPVERREQSSITFAVDSTLLPAAKELIKKFRRELNQLMQASDNRDHVYQLTVSLFPLTR